ncbi:RdRP-domain-containing protein [Meredithblackwellia eburnea MCA 4105]
MEVFVQGLPLGSNYIDLLDGVVMYVNAAAKATRNVADYNFHARTWIPKYNRQQVLGTLTFPDVDVARTFLDFTSSAFGLVSVRGRYPTFRASRDDPQPELINQLKSTPFVHPSKLRQDRDLLDRLLVPIPLASIAFGRFDDQDGAFSIEAPVYPISAGIYIDGETRHIKIELQHDGDLIRLSIPLYSVENFETVAVSQVPSQEVSLIASLSHPPKIEVLEASDEEFHYDDEDGPERQIWTRLSFIDSLQSTVLPFSASTLLLTFPSLQYFSQFKQRRNEARMQQFVENRTKVESRELCASTILTSLENRMKKVDFKIAFQIAVMLHNRLLSPSHLLKLFEDFVALSTSRTPEKVERILHLFATRLVGSSREEVTEDAVVKQEEYEGGLAPRPFDELVLQGDRRPRRSIRRLADLRDLLKKVAAIADFRKPPPRASIDASALSRHVIITPTSFLLEGPSPDQSNSILRRYEDFSDNFLRVSVRDEDLEKFRHDPDGDVAQFLLDRYLPLFESLAVAGRKFEFLGYSSSALRESSCWFISPFKKDGKMVTGDSIRSSLGNFDPIIHLPAKYFARLAQSFTATQRSLSLQPEEVRSMPDIKRPWGENGETVFTDGVGTISPDLAAEIEQVLNVGKRPSQLKRRVKPTTYQIRLGGAKGVVAVDPRFGPGKFIRVRPSMTKYDADPALEKTLDIAQTFRQPLPAYLNRPLIQVLEYLGVEHAALQKLQNTAVEEIESSMFDSRKAARLVERSGLSAPLHHLLRLLSSYKLDPLNEPFLRTCVEVAVTLGLRDIKHKARIPLPGSYTLVGIADEDGVLEEGEIYAAIAKDREEVVYLEGPICISRSPVIHPGDVQVAHFLVKGDRSLPSCLGGGDLDGDIYVLIPDPALHPPKLMVPGAYEGAEPVRLENPYILNDCTALIATRHLSLCDGDVENGPNSTECIKLAELHSHAVDFAKSGKPVEIRSIPRAPKMRPDFTCPAFRTSVASSGFYPSQKSLGKLFRSVPSQKVDPHFTTPTSARLDRLDLITSMLSGVVVFGEALGKPQPDLIRLFTSSIDTFSEELLHICRLCTLSKRSDLHLSEEEAFAGTIFGTAKDQRRRQDMIAKLKHQTSILFDGLVSEIRGETSDEENPLFAIDRAWGAWGAALKADKRKFGVRTFGFLALEVVLQQMKDLSY